MPVIRLETLIDAPRERVFDIARSIDAHRHSAGHTGEQAIAGRTSGLLEPGEEVTWQARHLGMRRKLRVRMTRFDRPDFFEDTMIKGAFHHMRHEHAFIARDGKTLMVDCFDFSSPFGAVGRLFDRLFLTGYMRRFLETRNESLKQLLESGDWKRHLPAK